jgi:hypothetical protein
VIDELGNSFNYMSNLTSTSEELLNYYACDGMLEYNPETQLPQYLPDKQDSVSTECMEALYKWYIDEQQTLSAYLVQWSPAMWQNIYLENYKQIEPSEYDMYKVSQFSYIVKHFASTSYVQPFWIPLHVMFLLGTKF